MKLFNVKILDDFTIDELNQMPDEELESLSRMTILNNLYDYPEFKRKHRRLLFYYFYEPKNKARKIRFVERAATYFGVSEQQINKALKVIRRNERFAGIDFEKIMDIDDQESDTEESIRFKEYVAAEERFNSRIKNGYFTGVELNEEVYV